VTALLAPLVSLCTFGLALLGALAWGIGLRVHESVMSAIARMIPRERRTTAYGLFMAIFGAT
jgi:hypothetical protein